ncbi:hypothetical protein [Paraflavitalea pollutisoli]|uniref:hypothetical protein n=1 Tax=Paraflavitalea pollutisoli TaxID=3034143 RepID=UPI0023EC1F41|nr:hypothetical protein [Paraflavitalea sp. H1-2-19X]
MTVDTTHAEQQILLVTNFEDLVGTPFSGVINAIGWTRELAGDFAEIVHKIEATENITTVDEEELLALTLSEAGQLARATILHDLQLLEAQGAAPVLNVIHYYDQDESDPFFPTDVYSWHVDRAPIPTATFLCTYYGASSDVLPNSKGTQKILIPAIRQELRKRYDGPEEGFDAFLREHFFDLHYAAAAGAQPVNLGLGNLWRLAVDHPDSPVPPSLHRAPRENAGEPRLLLIC